MAIVQDCGHNVRDFKLQSRHYLQFQNYTLLKGMTPPIHLVKG